MVVMVVLAARAGAEPTRKPSVLLPLESRWTTLLSAAPSASPVHDAGSLFVPLRNGRIAGVNLADGVLLWSVPQLVTGQPAAGNGTLYVATDTELAGLDTVSGLPRWSLPLEAELSAPLVWNAGWLLAPLDSGILLALRAETGEIIWRRALGGAIEVAPAIAGDRVYVSLDNGSLVALSLMNGDTVWAQTLDGVPQEVLPLDYLFVGATDNHFYCLSRSDGSITWRWRAGGDVVGRPAVDEQRVYFASLDNVLWSLDRTSGVQQWRQPLDVRPTAGPLQIDDLLLFAGLGQDISFFDPHDGTSYGRVQIPTELTHHLLHLKDAFGKPALIVVTGDGELRALGPASGPPLLDAAVRPVFESDPAVEDGISIAPTIDVPAIDVPAIDLPPGDVAPSGVGAIVR